MKRRHCHRARKNRGLAECGITQKHSGRLRLIFAKRGGPRKQIECEKSPAAMRAFPFYLATPGWTVLFVPPTVLVVPPRSADEASDCPDDRPLTIPWQKPPSKRSCDILLPHNASRRALGPAAGNGFFGCRDGAPKAGAKMRGRPQRPKSKNLMTENARRNAPFGVVPETCGLRRLDGGRDRDRTCDPLDVNEVLSR
jgi:hypothetical protein